MNLLDETSECSICREPVLTGEDHKFFLVFRLANGYYLHEACQHTRAAAELFMLTNLRHFVGLAGSYDCCLRLIEKENALLKARAAKAEKEPMI